MVCKCFTKSKLCLKVNTAFDHATDAGLRSDGIRS